MVNEMGVVGADEASLLVFSDEKVAMYDPTGTVVEKSWQNTVRVCPGAKFPPPTRT